MEIYVEDNLYVLTNLFQTLFSLGFYEILKAANNPNMLSFVSMFAVFSYLHHLSLDDNFHSIVSLERMFTLQQ